MAEKEKKAKAPAKPRAKAAKPIAIVEKVKPSQEEIARLAHKYWESERNAWPLRTAYLIDARDGGEASL